jgi:hypothetical protein
MVGEMGGLGVRTLDVFMARWADSVTQAGYARSLVEPPPPWPPLLHPVHEPDASILRFRDCLRTTWRDGFDQAEARPLSASTPA